MNQLTISPQFISAIERYKFQRQFEDLEWELKKLIDSVRNELYKREFYEF